MGDDFFEKDDREADPEDPLDDHDDAGFVAGPEDDDLDGLEYEPTPEERWESYLDTWSESDRPGQIMDALISLGCKKGELLQALFRVQTAYTYGSARRSELLTQAEEVADAQEYLPISVGDAFSNKDWKRLQDLLGRYEKHLRFQAERVKRNPKLTRKEALISLLALVQKWTREPQYQLLSELLRLFVDETLTEANVRQYAHRAELPKRRAAKPKLPARPRSTKGREADLSARTKGRRVREAKARAGLDDSEDDE